MPIPQFNDDWIDLLPEDIKINVIEYVNSLKEEAIIPLLESNLNNFETNFVQAGRYFLNYIIQIYSLFNSQNQNQNKDIMSNMVESIFNGLDESRKDFSKFSSEPFFPLLIDSTYVIENFIILSNMSTLSLNPKHYTKAYEAFVNISVCISALLSFKTTEKYIKQEIINLLYEKFEDNTCNLNELLDFIQKEEDIKAVMNGRCEYTENKTKKFNNIDDLLEELKSS